MQRFWQQWSESREQQHPVLRVNLHLLAGLPCLCPHIVLTLHTADCDHRPPTTRLPVAHLHCPSQTYARAPIVLTHGSGARVWGSDGKEYIDMAAGIAVNALGHSDKRWLATLTEQAAKLSHTSNLYHSQAQVTGN